MDYYVLKKEVKPLCQKKVVAVSKTCRKLHIPVTENEDPVLQLNVQERRLKGALSTSHQDESLRYNKANFLLEDTKELYQRGHSLKTEVIIRSF
jgi:hypothetical protein